MPSCISRKAYRFLLPVSWTFPMAQNIMDLIHIDVWGPVEVLSIGYQDIIFHLPVISDNEQLFFQASLEVQVALCV